MTDGEEKLIIARAVKGESSAFGQLYDVYQPQIYRFVYLRVGQREEAEDLTHQIFLHAWMRIKSYREEGYPFSTWLYRIARNQVIDHYRTRKVSQRIDEDREDQFVSGENVTLAVDAKLRLERVIRVIRTLPGDYQDVIVMRLVDEVPIRDVAKAMQRSEGAVKLLQFRATRALREVLEVEVEEESYEA